ncbi:hypothetical protein [Cohnella cholangitidis]|uniref:Uncharacterized protein n=1 Tax=Cohnella cholangitidis TaxID=2598458 RepID=A0A7G5C7H0_9BACL|nr:hypothetical protein [Cohnella cholangitidis]QMV45154.1 hypothetical protein FPL14_23795 [Cohnella cholangitidis]
MRISERWLDNQFEFSERHGISVPHLDCDWNELDIEHQTAILARWEMIRGCIPDHIMKFEDAIRVKQQRLFEEDDFALSCLINGEIADLASRINDLNIWFRTQQEIDDESKMHIG